MSYTPLVYPWMRSLPPQSLWLENLTATQQNKLRPGVSNALRTARPPRPNLSYTQKTALKDLCKDNTIVILPADKGNVTVFPLRREDEGDLTWWKHIPETKKGPNHIYMEHFEEKTLSSAILKPKVWQRYVDDTFVLWSHSRETLEAFLNHLNS